VQKNHPGLFEQIWCSGRRCEISTITEEGLLSRPAGAPLIRQLDAGLARLHDRGAIARTFEGGGVFEPRVADWKLVGYDQNNA
jgi:hypothetical protein